MLWCVQHQTRCFSTPLISGWQARVRASGALIPFGVKESDSNHRSMLVMCRTHRPRDCAYVLVCRFWSNFAKCSQTAKFSRACGGLEEARNARGARTGQLVYPFQNTAPRRPTSGGALPLTMHAGLQPDDPTSEWKGGCSHAAPWSVAAVACDMHHGSSMGCPRQAGGAWPAARCRENSDPIGPQNFTRDSRGRRPKSPAELHTGLARQTTKEPS